MDGDVYVLEESNFDKLVLQSKDIWMLEFYAPWCGHCKALQPEWDAAATAMKGQVKFGKIDATVHSNLAQRYGVKGYPTLKAFEYGEGKKDNKAIDYNGARDKPAMIEFASKLLEKADISPDIHEIFNQKVYDENCKGQTVCIISFLPNIYDSNAIERNQYIKTI
jgi:protein disulfide-isomerase A6